MNLLNLLIIGTLACYIMVPVYTLLRKKMHKVPEREDIPDDFYTVFRIIRTVVLHIAFTMSYIIMMLLITNELLAGEAANLSRVPALITFAFVMILTIITYGSGMYITTIISEEYTKKQLADQPDFQPLHISQLFFHGPLSHVVMYTGMLLAKVIMSQFELYIPQDNSNVAIFLVVGMAFGVVNGVAQITNLTWKHQLIWMPQVFLLQLVLAIINGVNIFDYNYHSFVFGNAVVTISIMLAKYAHYKYTDGEYPYEDYGIVFSKLTPKPHRH